MAQIATWLPGRGAAEQKGLELARRLSPFQTTIGLVGLASAGVWLLYWIGIFHVGGF
jgi:hypothetical protein